MDTGIPRNLMRRYAREQRADAVQVETSLARAERETVSWCYMDGLELVTP